MISAIATFSSRKEIYPYSSTSPHCERRAPRFSSLPVGQLDSDEPVRLHDPIGRSAASINFPEGIVRPGCIGFEYDCLHIFGAFHGYKPLFRIIVDTAEPRPAARVKIPFAKSFHIKSRPQLNTLRSALHINRDYSLQSLNRLTTRIFVRNSVLGQILRIKGPHTRIYSPKKQTEYHIS